MTHLCFLTSISSFDQEICVEAVAHTDQPCTVCIQRSSSRVQLLDGRSVRGPGTILKKLRTKEVNIAELKTISAYLKELREHLEDSLKLAQEEQQKSQKCYKKYFDKKYKSNCFELEDQLMILLPTDSYKSLMQWSGAYIVENRVGENDYRVKIGFKTKTYHLNMLKKYIARELEARSGCGTYK